VYRNTSPSRTSVSDLSQVSPNQIQQSRLAAQESFEPSSYAERCCSVSWGWTVGVRPVRGILPSCGPAGRFQEGDRAATAGRRGKAGRSGSRCSGQYASITQLVAFLQGEPLPPVDPIEVIGDGPTSTPTAVWTWQMWSVRWRQGGPRGSRSRSPSHAFPRLAWGRQRPCSLSGCQAYIGRTVLIGDTVRLAITEPCPGCVMITLPQGDLPKDSGILCTAAQHNAVNVGVYASVVNGGTIRRGDPVVFT
jgi:hypothetical protein